MSKKPQNNEDDVGAVIPHEYALNAPSLVSLTRSLVVDCETQAKINDPRPYLIGLKKAMLWGVVYDSLLDAMKEIESLYTLRTN